MRVGIAAGLVLVLSGAAWADLVDQQQTAQSGGLKFGSAQTVGQTFTAGLSGQLTSIDLGMYGDFFTGAPPVYPSTVEIRTTASNMPTDTVLGSVYMASGFTNGWNSIDLSSENIMMTADTMYSIVLRNDEVRQYIGYYTDAVYVKWDPTAYPDGQLVVNNGSGWFVFTNFMSQQGDAQFRTYVDTTVVPLPGAVVLCGIGLAFAGRMVQRKRLWAGPDDK